MASSPPAVDTVQTQVEALRKKLLDLTLRNRMLNYRPSKRVGITVIGKDSQQVHRILVDEGKKVPFTGLPDPPKRTDTSAPLFEDEPSDNPSVPPASPATQPLSSPDQQETKLTTREYESLLQTKLRTLARESTLAQDELGINTLFLTLGTLEWNETEDRSFKAPLIFVPVKLERQLNGALRLSHDGGDVGINLPLKAKLVQQGIIAPDLDDDAPLAGYFEAFSRAIEVQKLWIVHPNDISVGFFNYEKYVMYMDLGGESWPEDHKPWMCPDLVSMLGGGYSSPESNIGDQTMLDTVRPVSSAHEVFDADSSQTIALERVAAGHSVVIQGPPGTGKSQTITNIIAEAVAAGKTVLFVSAKKPALEVVKRNLDKAELGPMCLNLHDKLTNRREFYAEIKRTVGRAVNAKSEELRVARLGDLIKQLNDHSEAINEPLVQFGISPFQAMISLARLPDVTPDDRDGRIEFEALGSWKEPDIKAQLPAVKALQKRVQDVGVPDRHPFWGTWVDYLDPSVKLDLAEDLTTCITALTKCLEATRTVGQAFKVPAPVSASDMSVLRKCAYLATSAPAHDGVALKTSTWKSEETAVRELVDALLSRNKLKLDRADQVTAAIWQEDISSIAASFDRSAEVWYRFLSGSFRTSNRKLETFLTPAAPREPRKRVELLHDVLTVQRNEALINGAELAMRRLFGAQWAGLGTDPEVLTTLLTWVLQVHARVESGEVPSGLLDLFVGAFDRERLTQLLREAETSVAQAIAAYEKVAHLLRFSSDVVLTEELELLAGRAAGWSSNLGSLATFIAYSSARNVVTKAGLEAVAALADRWPLAGERLTASLLRSYYSGVLRVAMQERVELKAFERAGHEEAIEEFKTLDDFKLKYNRLQVRLAHQRRMPTFDNAAGNLLQLKIQCELKLKQKPIRWIMSRSGEAIQRIKPVFMMSPLTAAIHLPPDLPPFDLVVFDEASQVKPEDALCSIVRARQCIVVGDTRQMPPTNFFDRLTDDEEEETDNDSPEVELGNEARKLESILSLMAAVTIGRVRQPDLRWHYRSIHPSLIQPSNEMFYDNRLIVFPSPSLSQGGKRIGVVLHHHPETIYEAGSQKRYNRLEADLIAKHVLTHLETSPEQSLLIAAMNKSQADLIADELDRLERQNPQLFAKYRQLHPFEPLYSRNLENVQGDERDVVIISITYGRDSAGVIRQHWGPILRDGGERRLNVLITRARMRCEVFSNIIAQDIRTDSPSQGLTALKRYLQFAETGITDISCPTGETEESPFEEEVSLALRKYGYTVHPQIGSEGYRIDLGILDPERPGSYLLGVECDGATYHSARSARDRDKLRQRVLEARGWKLHRIWSHDWWQDRDGEITRLVAAIEAARSNSEVGPPTAPPAQTEPIIEEADRAPSASVPTRTYNPSPVPNAMTSTDDLSDYMVEVVKTEGPVHKDLLFHRLRNAAGYSRSGSQVRPWLNSVIASRSNEMRFMVDAYYWDDTQLRHPRDWSTRPAAEKKAEWVPEVEIAAALKSVVATSFGVSKEDAVRTAFNLIGFRRVTEGAFERGASVVARMISSGGLVVSDNGLLDVPRR